METATVGERESAIVETKLGILIGDFQRYREDQKKTNKELLSHAIDRETELATLNTTMKWHTIIGAFIMASVAELVWLHVKGLQ